MEVTRRTAIASVVAAIVSPIEHLVPLLSKSKPNYGIVYDGVDELIHLDEGFAEFTRGKIVDVRYFDRALSPTEVSYIAWFMSRDAESAPVFRKSREGSGIRFIESEMIVVETPKLKDEVP